MVTKAIACIITGTLIAVLAGCSPREEKVDGSIFIVTKGGENFKLGLVTVSVFDEQQITPYLAKPTVDLEKHLAELKAKVAKLNEEKENLIQKYNIADKKSDAPFQKYLEAASGDEGNRLREVYMKAKSVTDSYGKLIAENKQKLDSEVRQLQNWANEEPQVYFKNLPTPFAFSKTDADGKFSLVIPQKAQFILLAQAQRQVSDETERYYWLVRVHPDGKSEMQIMLSNDNLISVNSSESPVRFPMP
jgi:hypothetical protein